MPLRYSTMWMVVIACLVAVQEIRARGWPPINIPEFVSTVVVGAMIGYFLGWISWRAWAYKKYPPK
jgi:hypothetical protein